MNPVALLSCNTNPDYLTCLPMVVKSWQLQNFDVKVALIDDGIISNKEIAVVTRLLDDMHVDWRFDFAPQEFNPINKAMYTQCVRLYMHRSLKSGQYGIMGDADMFIASSFLYRDFDKVNVFGHDLTGFGEIPMCYVGMTKEKWEDVMGNDDLKTNLEKYSKYKSADWYEAWGADQQILTAKLKEYGYDKINFINRGTDPKNAGLPLGRWDRHNWARPSGEVHDVHMLRDPLSLKNKLRTLDMLYSVYKEDWHWADYFINEYYSAVYGS